jgi:hypothetical protein
MQKRPTKDSVEEFPEYNTMNIMNNTFDKPNTAVHTYFHGYFQKLSLLNRVS